MIRELKSSGKTIIMSTHLMNDIEELSDRLMMINKGREVLYGSLAEVKSKYRNNAVLVECVGEIGNIEGVTEQRRHNAAIELVLDAKTTPQMVLERLISKHIVVNRFELATPSLTEIFIKVAGDGHE
jgi:ABC-2 type transport system ATP-binding protein